MVYLFDECVTKKFDLEEYVSYVEDNIDVFDLESLVEHAWSLRALANNREFLIREYHNFLQQYLNDPADRRSLPQSIVPVRRENFYIRANIWLPIWGSGENSVFERSLYSYDVAHDHNYNFATVGYYGPGYTTELFEYDYRAVKGYEGEPVKLKPLGTEQLSPGRVMIYRAGRDVHIQNPPSSVSVSVNLMCRADDSLSPQQYLFDVKNSRIIKGAGDVVSMRLYLIDMMRYLNDDYTMNILSRFVKEHSCVRTKAYAFTVLDDLDSGAASKIRKNLTSDVLSLVGLPLVNGSDIVDRTV